MGRMYSDFTRFLQGYSTGTGNCSSFNEANPNDNDLEITSIQ